jgi:hypothetical protein
LVDQLGRERRRRLGSISALIAEMVNPWMPSRSHYIRSGYILALTVILFSACSLSLSIESL